MGDERPAKRRMISHEPSSDVAPTLGSLASQNGNAGQDTVMEQAAPVESEPVGSAGAPSAANGAHSPRTQPAAATGTEPSSTNGTESTPTPLDIAPIASNTAPSENPEAGLSKSQLKKLRKKQEWEAGRADRRVKRKEKVVAKRERRQAAREEAKANDPEYEAKMAQYQKDKASRIPAQLLPITFIIDCDFDDKMRDGERISLASQVTRSYSDNKNAPYHAHLVIASFGGLLKERFDTVLSAQYKQWKGVKFLPDDFVAVGEMAKRWMADPNPQKGGRLTGPVFQKYAENPELLENAKQEAETIYLSSDSDETLTELKPYCTYIIGGLVDKNREKGICHRRAVAAGVKTAKLPIGEYLDMASRKVLATNHVNEIMVRWLECGDWGEAFMRVIPKRKGGALKGTSQSEEPEESVENDEDEEGEGEAALAENGDAAVEDKKDVPPEVDAPEHTAGEQPQAIPGANPS